MAYTRRLVNLIDGLPLGVARRSPARIASVRECDESKTPF